MGFTSLLLILKIITMTDIHTIMLKGELKSLIKELQKVPRSTKLNAVPGDKHFVRTRLFTRDGANYDVSSSVKGYSFGGQVVSGGLLFYENDSTYSLHLYLPYGPNVFTKLTSTIGEPETSFINGYDEVPSGCHWKTAGLIHLGYLAHRSIFDGSYYNNFSEMTIASIPDKMWRDYIEDNSFVAEKSN